MVCSIIADRRRCQEAWLELKESFVSPVLSYALRSHLYLLPTISLPGIQTKGRDSSRPQRSLPGFIPLLFADLETEVHREGLTHCRSRNHWSAPMSNMPSRQGYVLVSAMYWAMLRAHMPHCQILKHTGHVVCTEKEASRIWHVTGCSFQSLRHPSS